MSTEKEKTYEFQPVQEFEHYVVTARGVYGFNRDSVFENWKDQQIIFTVKIDGEDAEYEPSVFFVKNGILYWITITGEKIVQENGEISFSPEFPNESPQPSGQFSGPVGKNYKVQYKEKPYEKWKDISNGKGYILNHQDSTFAYPLGKGKAVLYIPTDKTLYVVYTMPNGKPAIDYSLSLNQELKIF